MPCEMANQNQILFNASYIGTIRKLSYLEQKNTKSSSKFRSITFYIANKPLKLSQFVNKPEIGEAMKSENRFDL